MATATLKQAKHIAQRVELDDDKFVVSHDIPLFDEHETDEEVIGPDGRWDGRSMQTKRYTKAVLESMCRNMNDIIADTGDYVGICIGHTPTPEQRRAGQLPGPIVGFAGPFYVGTIGNVRPRPCIFAKNWAIYRDKAGMAADYPRRSVEVWLDEDMHRRRFDPIALLGAESPARKLGLSYSQSEMGLTYSDISILNGSRRVARYSMASAPAFPSGSNTFIPDAGGKKKRHADDGSTDDNIDEIDPSDGDEPASAGPKGKGGSSMPDSSQTPMARQSGGSLTDNDINQILEAFMESAPMQFLMRLMDETQAKASPTQVPPDASGMQDPNAPDSPTADPNQNPGAPPPGANAGAGPSGPPGKTPPPAKGDDMSATAQAPAAADPNANANPAAAPAGDDDKARKDTAERAKYAQMEAQLQALTSENEQLKTQLATTTKDATRKSRYSQIEQLAGTVLGFDHDDAIARADKVSDDVWEAFVDGVKRYSQRNPVKFAPLSIEQAQRVSSNQNETAKAQTVRERIRRYANQNIKKSYDEVVAEVEAEAGATA